jgi:hypothetical protein
MNWVDSVPIMATKEWMGHSRPETTMKYYLKSDEHHRIKAKEDVQNKIDTGRQKYAESFISEN